MNMVTSDELINDEEYEGTFILFQAGAGKSNSTQKSRRTSKRSAASTDPLSKSRSLVPLELASTSALARFTSNTKIRSQHRRPSRRSPVASSHGERSLRPSSRKRASMSRRGRRRSVRLFPPSRAFGIGTTKQRASLYTNPTMKLHARRFFLSCTLKLLGVLRGDELLVHYISCLSVHSLFSRLQPSLSTSRADVSRVGKHSVAASRDASPQISTSITELRGVFIRLCQK